MVAVMIMLVVRVLMRRVMRMPAVVVVCALRVVQLSPACAGARSRVAAVGAAQVGHHDVDGLLRLGRLGLEARGDREGAEEVHGEDGPGDADGDAHHLRRGEAAGAKGEEAERDGAGDGEGEADELRLVCVLVP